MRGAAVWILLAGLCGAFGVAAGAYAAHGAESALGAEARGWLETAATYALSHAPALLAFAWLSERPGLRPRRVIAAGAAMALGILLFCGALTAMALGGGKSLAGLAPIGGSLLILSWLGLAVLGLDALRRA